jgi:hypothetical protein
VIDPANVEPYANAGEHVRDELRRAWLRVEYQVRSTWTKGSPGEVRDEISIGPEDMGRIFLTARGNSVPVVPESGADAVLAEWMAAHREVEARIRATISTGLSPLADVIRAFSLTPRQWSTLMFALLPEIDPSFVDAYRYLARDASCTGLDGRLLAMLVYDTPQTRPLMARDLSPRSPLLRRQLVELTTERSSGSIMFKKIRGASRLVYLLDDAGTDLDPELADVAELRVDAASGAFPSELVEHASAALHSNEVILALQGQRGLGKKLLLQLAAGNSNCSLLVVDARRVATLPPAQQSHIVRALVREAILLNAIPAVVDVDDALTPENELPPFFDALLAEWNGPVAITIARDRMPRVYQRPIVHLTLEVPSLEVRSAMWRTLVPSLDHEAADSLSGRFAIPGGVIVAAAQAAAAHRLDDRPPDAVELELAVAGQLHERISRLGKRHATPFTLDDLVVDDDTRAALLEIVGAARARRRIREEFALRGAAGISVLFSGHPGVGKTMSGTVLARELGLEIYEIDLSQVVSKWLGETEKNLSEVFDAAEPGHVVLLFNEADSLFGKRTSEVKSSNDRYANLETNYLLQRLERFNGLAILTTNLTGAIDQAFKRRFSYDVFFSFPSREMREVLWRRTLPRRSATDIDFGSLAERFELSGGFIKVACERAAYVAGGGGGEITEDLLRRTIERMYRERGKLSTVGPLE